MGRVHQRPGRQCELRRRSAHPRGFACPCFWCEDARRRCSQRGGLFRPCIRTTGPNGFPSHSPLKRTKRTPLKGDVRYATFREKRVLYVVRFCTFQYGSLERSKKAVKCRGNRRHEGGAFFVRFCTFQYGRQKGLGRASRGHCTLCGASCGAHRPPSDGARP